MAKVEFELTPHHLEYYVEEIYSDICTSKKISKILVSEDDIRYVCQIIDAINSEDNERMGQSRFGCQYTDIYIPKAFERFLYPVKISLDTDSWTPNLKADLMWRDVDYVLKKLTDIAQNLDAMFKSDCFRLVNLMDTKVWKQKVVEVMPHYSVLSVGDLCERPANDDVWFIPVIKSLDIVAGSRRWKEDVVEARRRYICLMDWQGE